MFRKILSPFILLISLFFANVVFGQSVGDYRSVATGNWTTLSSWQYYDGSSWVTPSGTSPQGYPGQYTGTGTVLIQTGHTITINSVITTLSFGTLTITGTLTLTGDNSSGGMDFYLTTQSIIVTPAAGFIEFNSKVNLRLPVNATLQVTIGGLDVSSGCSANQVIYIGTTAYSKCNGGGSLPDFDDLMAGGGTLSPIATSNSPVCQNNTVNLLGSFSGAVGTTTSGGSTSGVNYSWSIQAPDASIQTSTLQNYSFTASQIGNYSATLTCTTYFGTTLYTNSKTISVTVTPTLLSVTINLTGLPDVCLLGTGTLLNVVETAGVTITSRQWGTRSVSGGTITPIGGQTASAFTVGTGLVVGTWIVVCTSVSSCGVSLVSNELTVSVGVLAPTVLLIQPTCSIPSGTVTVTSPVPAAGITYTVVGTSPVVAAVTNATGVFSGLTAGNYDVTVTNASGCTSSAAAVTISPLVTKTWTGTWSPAGAPTSNNLVIIDANYSASSDGDLNACSLVINSGHTLTVEALQFVIIQNDLTVNGILNVLDKGSLVMVNDAGVVTNTGTTNILRTTTPYKKNDYTYWSTPVASTNIPTTFVGWKTSYAFGYDPTKFFDGPDADSNDDNGDDWVRATTMTPAKGYAIMGLSTTPTTISTISFNGKVNNGVQKITGVIPDGYYLVGNPYPSAIDADDFISDNAGVIDGTLYFWTHNTAIQLASGIAASKAGTGVYAFTSDDYASYNGVGGVASAAAISGGVIPSGRIASCQGFFAKTNTTIVGANEIVFNNAMRLGSGGATLNNLDFFKTKKQKGTIEKHRIWLNLSNAKGAFKQTLLGYVTGATNDKDIRFDGETMDGNQFIDFYSINQDKNLVIQGRALPFDENDAVSLGYRTTIAGIFTINIQKVDGVLTNQDVFIEDKLTNTVFDLKNGNYTFNTVVGTFNDRFVLRYRNDIMNKTLETNDLQAAVNEVLVSSMNKQIKINSFAEMIDNVTVYDVLGRQIFQKIKVDANELLITDLVSSDQTFVVKTELQNGTIVTDKIIF